MTEEEKKELEKLDKKDLLATLIALKDKEEARGKMFDEQRKKIISKFLNGDEKTEQEEDNADAFDLARNKAFARLKKKF